MSKENCGAFECEVLMRAIVNFARLLREDKNC